MKLFDFFKKKIGSARPRKRPTLDFKQLQVKLRNGSWKDIDEDQRTEQGTYRYVNLYSNGVVTIDNEG